MSAFAVMRGMDASKIARKAIEEYLDEINDAIVAEKRAMNPGKTYTLVEAEKLLELSSQNR